VLRLYERAQIGLERVGSYMAMNQPTMKAASVARANLTKARNARDEYAVAAHALIGAKLSSRESR
ncbi:MAG: hypothetical protein ACRDSN_06950, partial [Pseudonocardiaceae bacterium]